MYVLSKNFKSKLIVEKLSCCYSNYLEISTPSDLNGRPIVPATIFAVLVEKILSPIVTLMKPYIKDNWDFLKEIPRKIDYKCNLTSEDIVSLYTSIDHKLDIEAINCWINRYRQNIPSHFTNQFIEEACLFVLQNNYVKFNIMATINWTNFAPPYACLTIGF